MLYWHAELDHPHMIRDWLKRLLNSQEYELFSQIQGNGTELFLLEILHKYKIDLVREVLQAFDVQQLKKLSQNEVRQLLFARSGRQEKEEACSDTLWE